MKKTGVYYFLITLIIGACIYTCEKIGIVLPKIIRFYVNDFLIVPIVLFLSLWIVRKLKSNNKLQLSIAQVLYVCALYAIIFEYWLPKFHPRYTADSIDVLLYFGSGVIFYFIQKQC